MIDLTSDAIERKKKGCKFNFFILKLKHITLCILSNPNSIRIVGLRGVQGGYTICG